MSVDAPLLDTLVKLAGLGAGGICIFAIFWVGWLISKLPSDASLHQHKTLRLFMGMTIAIAVVAFASGFANAWFNAKEIEEVKQQKMSAETDAKRLAETLQEVKDATREQTAQYQAEKARNEEIVKSLAVVLNEKELSSMASGASSDIKSHIRILKESIQQLQSTSRME